MNIERKHLKVFGSWLSEARGKTPSSEKAGKKMSQIELSRMCGGKNIAITESGGNEPRLGLLIKVVHHTKCVPDPALWEELYKQQLIYEEQLEAARKNKNKLITVQQT